MNILIVGGDLRYLEVIDDLKEKYCVSVMGYSNTFIDGVKKVGTDLDVSLFDVIIFPVNGVLDNNCINARFDHPINLNDSFLVNTKENVRIFSGVSTPCLDKMLKLAKRECYYLMNDMDVVKANCIPTVEGILGDIIYNTPITIKDAKVLIFGYGNIGSMLVHYLNLLGANISVFVIKEDDKVELDNMKIKCFYKSHNDLIEQISCSDIIINTAPTCVISDHDIRFINRDAYVLDIASYPHGIDQEVLAEYFIKGKLYLGIPGKIAPKTSGKILSKKINDIMKGR